MLLNLVCIVFIELITIGITTSRNLDNDYDVVETSDLQGLLKTFQDGNVRNNFPNQQDAQDRNSKLIHDDAKNLMNIQTLNLIFKHNNLRNDKTTEKIDPNNKDINMVNTILCAITGSYGCSEHDYSNQGETPNDRRPFDNTDLLHEVQEKLSKYTGDDATSDDPDHNNYEVEAQKDFELLLKDVNYKSLDKEDRELRCKRCGRGRNDQERCGDDDHYPNKLRCGHNRCGKDRDYQRNEVLRCIGDRCERFRTEDDGREDNLRCRGNRCGRDLVDYDDGDTDVHNDLRCRKKRCQRGRSGDSDDDNTRDESDTEEYDGSRCGGHRHDDNNGGEIDELRCSGNRCGINKNHDADADIDNDFKSVLDNYGKRYKINNDIDAIVLDVDKLENGLDSLYSTNLRKKKNLHTLYNKQKQIHKKQLKNQPSLVPKNPFNVKERLFTFAQFLTFLKDKLKQEPIQRALDYIKDESRSNNYLTYFKKNPIGREDEKFLKKLKSYYHNKLAPPKQRYLPYIEEVLKNQLGINKLDVVEGESNNQIAVPQPIFSEIKNKNPRDRI